MMVFIIGTFAIGSLIAIAFFKGAHTEDYIERDMTNEGVIDETKRDY